MSPARFGSVVFALFALTSACDPSFNPDWQLPHPADLLDGAVEDPGPPGPYDAAQDADAASDASGASADTGAPNDGGPMMPPAPNCTQANNCVDAGPACVPVCVAPCIEVPCIQGTLCQTSGLCGVECSTCAVPPIK